MSAASQPPSPPTAPPSDAGRRVGRKIGWGLYATFVLLVTLVPAAQVFRGALFPPKPDTPAPFDDCRAGLRALHQSIVDGREAAAQVEAATHEPEVALRRYREVVDRVWQHRRRAAELCEPDPALSGALDALERLRYAEEHGVRSQTAGLGPLRRRVAEIVARSL